jgi:uncharacterized protein
MPGGTGVGFGCRSERAHDVVDSFVPRLLDDPIALALSQHPAVMIVGPRACGKTTTARGLSRVSVPLDAPTGAAAFKADPDAALEALTDRPLLLDEWQEIPEVIGAVKRSVDAGAPPGSYIMTGSVRATVAQETWPGTGRIVQFDMAPLTMREQLGRTRTPGLIERALADTLRLGPLSEPPKLGDYVAIALAGGFPEPALRLDAAAQSRWYRSYVQEIIGRDVAAILHRSDPDRMRRYLQALALNSANATDHATIFAAAGVTRRTAEGYESVLQRLFLTQTAPAWSTNRLKRLTRMPKRYIVDPGLLAACGGFSRTDVLWETNLLGMMMETLVVAQLRAELSAKHPDVGLHHLRTEKGQHEIDLILTVGAGRVIAVEIKSAASVNRAAARHLAWLRDALRDDFVLGIVFHTGPTAYELDDRLVALPIASLWS